MIDILPFEEILFEEGTHFDLPTGTFTCNVTGIYVLMFSLLKTSSASSAYASLTKNDDVIVRAYASGAGSYSQASNSAILSLQKGDRVFLSAGGSLRSDNRHHTSFSGFLLFGES